MSQLEDLAETIKTTDALETGSTTESEARMFGKRLRNLGEKAPVNGDAQKSSFKSSLGFAPTQMDREVLAAAEPVEAEDFIGELSERGSAFDRIVKAPAQKNFLSGLKLPKLNLGKAIERTRASLDAATDTVKSSARDVQAALQEKLATLGDTYADLPFSSYSRSLLPADQSTGSLLDHVTLDLPSRYNSYATSPVEMTTGAQIGKTLVDTTNGIKKLGSDVKASTNDTINSIVARAKRAGDTLAGWFTPSKTDKPMADEKQAIGEIAADLAASKLLEDTAPEEVTAEPVITNPTRAELSDRFKNLYIEKKPVSYSVGGEEIDGDTKLFDYLDAPVEAEDLDIPAALVSETIQPKAPSLLQRIHSVGDSLKKSSMDLIKRHPGEVFGFGSAAAGLLLSGVLIASLHGAPETATTNPMPVAAPADAVQTFNAPAQNDIHAPTAVERAIALIRNDPSISKRALASLDSATAGRAYGKLDLAYYLNNGIDGVEKDTVLARAVAEELSADGYKRADTFIAQMDGHTLAKPTLTKRYTVTFPAAKTVHHDASQHTDTATDTGTTETGKAIAPVSSSTDTTLKSGVKKEIFSNGRVVHRDLKTGRFISAKEAFNRAAANLEPSMDSEPSPAVPPASAPTASLEVGTLHISPALPNDGVFIATTAGMHGGDFVRVHNDVTGIEIAATLAAEPGEEVSTLQFTTGALKNSFNILLAKTTKPSAVAMLTNTGAQPTVAPLLN